MTSSQTRIPTVLRRALPPALFLLTLHLLAAPIHAGALPASANAPLAISARRGDRVAQQIILRGAQGQSGLHFVAQDLAGSQGQPPLAAASISAQLPLTGPVGYDLAVNMVVDLSDAAPGRYSGEALVVYAEWQHPVSLLVSVKERPLLPLLVLLLGVGLGLLFGWLRRPRREEFPAEIALGVRAVTKSAEAAAPFRIRSDRYLARAAAAEQRGDRARAQAERARAGRVIEIWQREAAEWPGVLEQLESLRAQLTEGVTLRREPIPFLHDLRLGVDAVLEQTLEDALLQFAAGKSEARPARRLGERLARAEWALEHYAALHVEMGRQHALAAHGGDPAAAHYALLRTELNQIRPWSDPGAESALAGLCARVLADEEPESAAPVRLAAPVAPVALVVETSPVVGPVEPAHWEGVRRRAVLALALFAALVLVAGAGYRLLYVQNEVFGAAGWIDWLSLLVWGFGSESGRAALAGVLLRAPGV